MPSSRPSIADIRATGQPPELMARYSGEHWAGRLYARRISPYVTWFLLRLGVSANAVTILMALIGMAGAMLYALDGFAWAILGAVLVQVYLLLDCSDGEIARWRGTTGAIGIFLDRLGHYLVEATLFVALGLRIGDQDGRLIWVVAGFAAALVHVLGKVETDLVHMARAKAGLALVKDDAETSVPASGLGAARRALRILPIYRLTGAIEASLIMLAAVVAEEVAASLVWTQAVLGGFLVVTCMILAGHFLMIVASNRLRA